MNCTIHNVLILMLGALLVTSWAWWNTSGSRLETLALWLCWKGEMAKSVNDKIMESGWDLSRIQSWCWGFQSLFVLNYVPCGGFEAHTLSLVGISLEPRAPWLLIHWGIWLIMGGDPSGWDWLLEGSSPCCLRRINRIGLGSSPEPVPRVFVRGEP